MWGVQIVATEFSDDFRQLQLILNHPVGEIVQKHHLGPFRGQKCPFGVPGGPEEAPYQAKVCGNHNTSPVRPIGTKCGPRGPSEDLWDLQMGHLGPTWVLLGFLVAQKRPDTRPKCVLTIIPAKSDQLATVGTKAGPSGAFLPVRVCLRPRGPF